MKNLALTLASLLISVLIVEGLLQVFTEYPISNSSNRISDPLYGYRVSSELDDIDAAGFRNAEGAGNDVAAIGDSHTYGYNVTRPEAWPAVLADMTGIPVYNFGVGSYGLYTYHALIHEAVRQDADVAIVALYPVNDFIARYSYCDIDRSADFWRTEADRLELDFAACPVSHKEPGLLDTIDDFIDDHTALGSIYRIHIKDLLKSSSAFVPVEGTNTNVPAKDIRRQGENVDTATPDVAAMVDDFGRFLGDWAELARTSQMTIAILIIPSKQLALTDFALGTGVTQSSQDLLTVVERERGFIEMLVSMVTDAGLAVDTALSDLVAARSATTLDVLFPDGHPLAEGQQAYANAALRLLRQVCERDSAVSVCASLPAP